MSSLDCVLCLDLLLAGAALFIMGFMESQEAPVGCRWKMPHLSQAGRLPADGPQMVASSEQWDGARGGVLGEGGDQA